MGAVAADAVLVVIFIRKRIHVGVRRHRLVEGRIEGDDLRDRRQDRLDGMDAEQVGRVVERGEFRAVGDLVQHVLVHKGAAGEEIAALDDAVADRLDVLEGLQNAGLRVGEGVEDELHADLVVGNRQVDDLFFPARRRILENTHRKADLFDDTLRDDIIKVVILHVQQLVLDRGAAAVDNKDDHNISFLAAQRYNNFLNSMPFPPTK